MFWSKNHSMSYCVRIYQNVNFFLKYIYMLKNNITFHFHHFLSIVGEESRERYRPNMTRCI